MSTEKPRERFVGISLVWGFDVKFSYFFWFASSFSLFSANDGGFFRGWGRAFLRKHGSFARFRHDDHDVCLMGVFVISVVLTHCLGLARSCVGNVGMVFCEIPMCWASYSFGEEDGHMCGDMHQG